MSAGIDEPLVRHLAHLARLTLDDAEVGVMAKELSVIVGYVDLLRSLGTDGVSPTAHPSAVQNVFRDDLVADSYESGAAMGNAPAPQAGFFSVPKVLEGESGA